MKVMDGGDWLPLCGTSKLWQKSSHVHCVLGAAEWSSGACNILGGDTCRQNSSDPDKVVEN